LQRQKQRNYKDKTKTKRQKRLQTTFIAFINCLVFLTILKNNLRYEKSFYFNGCYHGSVLAACLVVFINCILIDLYY